MVDAPERIWADLNMGIWLGRPQPDRRPRPPEEYVRADLVDSMKAERDEWEALAENTGIRMEKLICEKAGYEWVSGGSVNTVMLLDKLVAERDTLLEKLTATEHVLREVQEQRDDLVKEVSRLKEELLAETYCGDTVREARRLAERKGGSSE